jgi:hypothetical protein
MIFFVYAIFEIDFFYQSLRDLSGFLMFFVILSKNFQPHLHVNTFILD